MAIKQVAFDIPLEIQEKLLSGEFIRYGGIVRDKSGRIIAHLKEIVPQSAKNSIVSFLHKNKTAIIIASIAVVLTTAAGITYVVVKNKKNNEDESIPTFIADFNEAFEQYLKSIKTGTVDVDKINNVISSLSEIQQKCDDGKIKIDFSIENLNELVDIIKNYTIQLANANSIEIKSLDNNNTNKMVQLQHYLEVQKQVFDKCA